MTENSHQSMESAALAAAPAQGQHKLSFRGASDGRFAACACQEWRLPVAGKDAGAVVGEFRGHLGAVQAGGQGTASAPRYQEPEYAPLTRPAGSYSAASGAGGRAANARAVISQMLVGGLILGALGTVLSLATAGTAVVFLCLLAMAVGDALVFVALLAWGVRLGIEASRQEARA